MITPGPDAMDIGNRTPGDHFGTYYWEGPGRKVSANLTDDDSRIIMDRVLPFIEKAGRNRQPFLAVIWFHSPHLPVLTGEQYRGLYEEYSNDQQHFYGCISAMDNQIGRLHQLLEEMNLDGNTMIWFCSDNGPEGNEVVNRTQGTTSGLKGRKRSLFEGGVRVPAFLSWPDGIANPRPLSIPCTTSDYLPTIMDLLGIKQQNVVYDGISLVPLLNGEMEARPQPIGFIHQKQIALIDNDYKLISQDLGGTYSLFDLVHDPGEKINLRDSLPHINQQMIGKLQVWIEEVTNIQK
jgi:arylsulfatase A-like enzyme